MTFGASEILISPNGNIDGALPYYDWPTVTHEAKHRQGHRMGQRNVIIFQGRYTFLYFPERRP